jgi:hypothetical protein
MSRLSRSVRLLQNAEAALISSIEIYNKPAFAYREETFSILALNAWELLLKAKLLAINNNELRCLYVRFTKQTATGTQSTKQYIKRNRTGNMMTVGIDGCIVLLEKQGIAVPEPIKKNLAALAEVRDNAVHYINASPQLSKQVLEIGTACLRNFIEIGKQWLDLDLSSYSLYLMPIGFLPSAEAATAITLSNHEQKIVNYLASLMREAHEGDVRDYHVSLDVNISFKRTSAAVAWIVGGAIVLFGASCYAELGAAMPEAGGDYVYQSRGLSPLCGFLYGWTSSMIMKPGSAAIIAAGLLRFVGFLLPSVARPISVGIFGFLFNRNRIYTQNPIKTCN